MIPASLLVVSIANSNHLAISYQRSNFLDHQYFVVLPMHLYWHYITLLLLTSLWLRYCLHQYLGYRYCYYRKILLILRLLMVPIRNQLYCHCCYHLYLLSNLDHLMVHPLVIMLSQLIELIHLSIHLHLYLVEYRYHLHLLDHLLHLLYLILGYLLVVKIVRCNRLEPTRQICTHHYHQLLLSLPIHQ